MSGSWRKHKRVLQSRNPRRRYDPVDEEVGEMILDKVEHLREIQDIVGEEIQLKPIRIPRRILAARRGKRKPGRRRKR